MICQFLCDDQNALHLAADQMMDISMKHIDKMYHFIKDA